MNPLTGFGSYFPINTWQAVPTNAWSLSHGQWIIASQAIRTRWGLSEHQKTNCRYRIVSLRTVPWGAPSFT